MPPVIRFDDEVFVSYGFIYLDSGVGGWDEDLDQRAGQRNGLAGAAQTGFVLLTTGTHTGSVPLRVEEHPAEPPLDESWDEIVEVSCDLRGVELDLSAFDGWVADLAVTQNGPHRLRYSARRFDAEDEGPGPVPEGYLVQLWPAPMAADAVLRRTSSRAQYWHRVARKAKQANPAAVDQARATRKAEKKAARKLIADEEEFEHQQMLWKWGGRAPSPRLRAAASSLGLTVRHRDLVDEIEVLDDAQQRRLARAVARQMCADDHDSPVDWSPALSALEQGRPLPAPFDDEEALNAVMFGPTSAVTYEVSISAGPSEPPALHTGVVAAAAVRGAADPDPFRAALRTVEAASWAEPDADRLAAQVRAHVRAG